MADPKHQSDAPLNVSGIREVARRSSYPGIDTAQIVTARNELMRAMHDEARVCITLRVDVTSTEPPRTIEGVPTEFRLGTDGRERVVLAVAPEAEQTVLVERIDTVVRGD